MSKTNLVSQVHCEGTGVLSSFIDVRAPSAEAAIDLVKRKLSEERMEQVSGNCGADEKCVTYWAIHNASCDFHPLSPMDFDSAECTDTQTDETYDVDEYFAPKT